MDEILEDYMANNGSTSASTKKTLQTGLKRLEKILEKDFDKIRISDFKNAEKMVDKITDLYSLNTTISTILSINRFLLFKKANMKLIGQYREILNDLIQERNKGLGNQEFKEGEKENWMDYEELKNQVEEKAADYLDNKKSFTDYRNFLILSLFTLMPPARVGNYLNMIKKDSDNMKQKLSSLNKKFNYIVKKDNTYSLVFNQYKTAKVLGKVIYEVENEILIDLLDKYFSDYNKDDKNKFFMINASGKPMTQTNFTNAQSSITKKLFQKNITNNMFRRIFFTHFLSTNPSVEEKQKILRISGQNYKPSQVEKYDRKKGVEAEGSSNSKDKEIEELKIQIEELKKED